MNDLNANDQARFLPWYRQPWPWLLMIAPAAAVIGGAVTIWLAVRSDDGLVTDDYYKQGLAINQITARDEQAQNLDLRADLMIGADGRELRLMLHAKPDFSMPQALVVRLAHPTRAGIDQILRLQRQSSGIYIGHLAQGVGGRWRVSLEDEQKAWRLTGEWMTDKTPVLHMP